MSRCCRSANDRPSVTMYCSVFTLLFWIDGLKVSDRTPSATVNQTFDVVLRAVPKQSLRARSRYDWAPGLPGAACAAARWDAFETAPPIDAVTASTTAIAAIPRTLRVFAV